ASMRATRLVRPGAPSGSKPGRSSPLPSRYARSTSLVRTSCPEPTEPSFTHWFLMSCWSSSTLSPVSVSLIAPLPSGSLEQGGERAVRALRALGGRLLGGGAARRLDGERRVGRQRRDKLRQRQHPFTGQEPAGARLADERARGGRTPPVRDRAADLNVAQERRSAARYG